MAEDRRLAPALQAHMRDMGPSPTIAVNEHCHALQASGREVFRMGLGQSPFPVPGPVVEALQANAWRKDYLPVRGLRALRDAVADYHRRRDGLSYSGDDLLIGPGSKELMFLLQVVFDGELLVPTPAWVSYAPQARILDRRVTLLHARSEDGWRLLPEALDEACTTPPDRPRILILNYPSNPTGGTYSAEQLQALAEVARRRKVVVLSDEIYGELHFHGRHISIGRYYPEGTIVSSGLSKWCGAGGWRLGTFAFPRPLRWLLDAMAVVASESFTATSAPIQHAAVRAFEGGPLIERYLGRARRVLAALVGAVETRLRSRDVRVHPAEGAFYLFPDFSAFAAPLAARGIETSQVLCHRLLEETGVAVLPGVDFGRAERELTARMALVDFDGARALAEVAALPAEVPIDEGFLRSQCYGVLEATDRICRWLG